MKQKPRTYAIGVPDWLIDHVGLRNAGLVQSLSMRASNREFAEVTATYIPRVGKNVKHYPRKRGATR